MTEAEKYSALIEKIPQVNEAGKNSMLKYHPEATVSGSYISLDDVSELPHEVKCKISGVSDPTTVKVMGCGKNLLCYPYAHTTKEVSGVTVTDNGDGTLTVNGTPTANISFQLINTNKHRIKLLKGVTYSFNIGFVDVKQKIYGYVAYDNGTADTAGTLTYVYDYGTTGGNTFTPTQDVYLNSASIIVLAGNTFNNAVLKPQLEFWKKTDFEPYNGATYTPNADGTVEGMTSISPYMNILTNTEGANIEATYRKSKGMRAEYDRFWDSYQDRGNRTSYSTAFGGLGWTDATFKPKYNMNPTDTYMMFRGTRITDLSNLDVILNFSKASNMQYMFQTAKTQHVGVLDMSSVTTQTHSMFYYADELHTIDKIIATEKNVFDNSSFNGCSQLKNIVFEGVIGSNISFGVCPLSKASFESIINALSSTKTGLTATFNKVAKEAAFTSEEWATLIATKPNWGFAYV